MFHFNKNTHGYQVEFDHKYTVESSRMGLKWIKEQMKDINSLGYLSEELGIELQHFFEDVGYIGNDNHFTHLGYNAGIHLTGYTDVTNSYIEDVFSHGLINNGHAMSGAVLSGIPNINLTVTPFDSVIFAIRHLKLGNTYKKSHAAILIKYPHDIENNMESLQYFDGSVYRIFPNFIYGIVMIGKDNVVGDIIRNPNYNLNKDLKIK